MPLSKLCNIYHKLVRFYNVFIFGRFQETLNCLFHNREEIREECLKLEMLLKENELKSFYQQQCHKQIEMVCSEDKVKKVFNNLIIKF